MSGAGAEPPTYDIRLARLSTDADRWRAWWTENQRRVDGSGRFRLGVPIGPSSMVASLEDESVPARLRRWIADELAARHQMPIRFDAAWDVGRQRAAIQTIRAWAGSERALPGRWYLAGEVADR